MKLYEMLEKRASGIIEPEQQLTALTYLISKILKKKKKKKMTKKASPSPEMFEKMEQQVLSPDLLKKKILENIKGPNVAVEGAASNLLKRPISGILGRSSSPLLALAFLTTDPLRKGTTAGDVENLLKNTNFATDTLGGEKLKVYANKTQTLDQLKKIWKRKDLNPVFKTLGSLTMPYDNLMASLTRADHYNPASHTVTTFTRNPTILAHELGHATDWAKRKNPGVYALSRFIPGMAPYQEMKANMIAAKQLEALEQRWTKKFGPELANKLKNQFNRMLSSNISNYTAAEVAKYLMPGVPGIVRQNIALPAAMVGGIAGRAIKPFSWLLKRMKK